jgi:hypothetical protein
LVSHIKGRTEIARVLRRIFGSKSGGRLERIFEIFGLIILH